MTSNGRSEAGCLRLQHSGPPERYVEYIVNPNSQFEIGRREIEDALNVRTPSISTHHLCFRCVNYEEEGERRVAPMVYVRVLSKNSVLLSRHDDGGKHDVSNADPDVLLGDGDVLQLTPSISIEFIASESYATVSDGMHSTLIRECKYFENDYHITDRRLGVGAQASVCVAIKKQTQRQVACKIVHVPFLAPEEVERLEELRPSDRKREMEFQKARRHVLKVRKDLKREYSILKELNHPNIVALEKVFYTPKNIYIFQELVTGGDLMSFMEQKGAMSEPQSAVITRQILKAIEYLHDNGVVHRDLKPENILMTSWRDGARLVLTDFGQSRLIGGDKPTAKTSTVLRMQTLVGTTGYAAPELLRQMAKFPDDEGYSKAIDIWAVGCITASLLTRDFLFKNQPEQDREFTPEQWEEKRLLFTDLSALDTDEKWRSVGRKAKGFIRGCLIEDESERLTAKQALQHIWLDDPHYADELEAVYQRAIQDWKPRTLDNNVIEFIDTTVKNNQPATETKSRHFVGVPPTLQNDSFFLNRSQTSAGMMRPARAEDSPALELAGTMGSVNGESERAIPASAKQSDFTQYAQRV